MRLITEDKPFHTPEEALVAYAHMGLRFVLATMKKDAFCSPISQLSKSPLVEDSAADRLAGFKTAFGKTPDALEPNLFGTIHSLVENANIYRRPKQSNPYNLTCLVASCLRHPHEPYNRSLARPRGNLVEDTTGLCEG